MSPALYVIGEASSGLHGANRLGGNSLIELLVYRADRGRAAAEYSAALTAQRRSPASVAAAQGDCRPAAPGRRSRERPRAPADRAGSHDRAWRGGTRRGGLKAGLTGLDEVEERVSGIGVHPDFAGFQDLAHAFDLKSAAPGCPRHPRLRARPARNPGMPQPLGLPGPRSGPPGQSLWSPSEGVTREPFHRSRPRSRR